MPRQNWMADPPGGSALSLPSLTTLPSRCPLAGCLGMQVSGTLYLSDQSLALHGRVFSGVSFEVPWSEVASMEDRGSVDGRGMLSAVYVQTRDGREMVISVSAMTGGGALGPTMTRLLQQGRAGEAGDGWDVGGQTTAPA